ncbi:MAG: copper resistance protein CopC, partial [Jatrophihabitantaceae bacterium]
MAASERVRPASWLRRFGLLLAIAVGLLAFGPQPAAQAHAFLLSSNPADGAVLPAAPSQLRLQFSETVVVEVTRIDVVGADGSTVRPSHLRLTGNSADPEDPVELVGDLPALANGAFRVSWQTLSRDDLHRTAGVFVFGVGERVSPAGVSEPRPRAEEAALRWLLFLGLAGCLGGALAGRLAMTAPAVKRPLAATAKVSAAGAVIALLASWALLAEQARVSGVAIGRLLTGSYGAHWMLREFGVLLLVIAAGIALSHRLRPVRLGCLIAGAALAALGSAELGHARSAGPTALLADGAHLVAAAVWSGTLACLVCLALVGSRAGDRSAAIRASLVGFGRPALCCVATILITGVYLSSTVVGSVDAALLTFYGRVLLVKVAIFGAIAVLGLVNHGWVRRPGRLPRASLLAEA